MNRMKTAMAASSLELRFRSRESSRAKGSAKWPSTKARATYSQPPFSRVRYQGISSGRLPAQIIRNCENEKYAHHDQRQQKLSQIVEVARGKDLGHRQAIGK